MRLGEIAIRQKCLVISDEVYNAFVYAGNEYYSLSSFFSENNFISVNSFSKTYAMMGYRIGWVISEAEVIKKLIAIQSQFSSGANNFGQMLAVSVMNVGESEVEEMKKEFEQRRETVTGFMEKMKLKFFPPQGAFYVFFKTPTRIHFKHSLVFCEQLEENGVAMVPGDESGAPGWVRMCYAASREDLIEGLSRLEKFIAK
jgi:aspartate aminotransferase